ncbi:MAG: MBOAT family O-acyltransferase, partial [Lachnospiraceae bacterium]
LLMMLWGLFQKMVIADRLSILVDHVFNNVYAYGTFELLTAAIGFSIQIYCDFNGYSTIAIGAARVMGFTLMDNFNTPYFAISIKDFWRRWHISLSTWFRDYLYIPLGGNRCSTTRKYANIMITFLASGLWHGASWSYVIWGGLHGLYQIIGEILTPLKQKLLQFLRVEKDNFSFKFGQILTTFFLTTFAWIFFRAEGVKNALYFIRRLFTRWNPWVLFDQSMYQLGLDRIEVNILFFSLLVLLLVDLLKYLKNMEFSAFLMKQNLWFRWIVTLALIVVILVYGEYGVNFDSTQFIYFNF